MSRRAASAAGAGGGGIFAGWVGGCDAAPVWSTLSNPFESWGWDGSADGGIDHYFHALRGEGAYYVCLSDDVSASHTPIDLNFLNDVQRSFSTKYSPSKVLRAQAYGMDKGFRRYLSELVHNVNTGRSTAGTDGKVLQLRAKVGTLKSLMGDNIEMVARRGDTLDQLVHQSDEATVKAMVFKKKSVAHKKAMGRKQMQWWLIIAGVVVGITLVLVLMMCGLSFDRCRISTYQNGGG